MKIFGPNGPWFTVPERQERWQVARQHQNLATWHVFAVKFIMPAAAQAGKPVSSWLAEAAAGFLIERLLEPRPVPGTAAIDPGRYERLGREPRGFIAFRLRPRT
jgi:hypothetical protein